MPANLYQRNGSPYWWARIQINGRDERRSLRTANRAEAKRRLKALIEEAERERAGLSPREVYYWQDAVVRWSEMELAGLRPSTVSRYMTSLTQLDPYLKGKALPTISTATIHAYAAARLKSGVTQATVRRDLTVASRVLQVAKRAGWIAANPVPEEAGELTERREPIQPVTLRQLGLITRRFPAGLVDMVRFLARTGCRQEEAASLEWEQLDLSSGTATLAKTKTRSPRVIGLSTQTVRDLARIKPKGATGHVFRSPSGKRYTNIPGRWRVLVRLALKPKPGEAVPRCHDLRHTYGIRALQQGMDIYALARHLGHSSVKTTERYVAWIRTEPAQNPAQHRSHRRGRRPD